MPSLRHATREKINHQLQNYSARRGMCLYKATSGNRIAGCADKGGIRGKEQSRLWYYAKCDQYPNSGSRKPDWGNRFFKEKRSDRLLLTQPSKPSGQLLTNPKCI